MIEHIYTLNFEIELLTGMHIGGYESNFDIGGADSTVIKNPLTGEPYIPGSSLKGKLKSLLCLINGEFTKDHKDIMIKDDDIRNIFESVVISDTRPSVTRGIFRDLYLTKESIDKLERILGAGVYTEIKAENRINKLDGKAGNPRFIERVPAGAVFGGSIVLTLYHGDPCEKMKDALQTALRLLEKNYIGGSGTRGYGRVKILKEEWIDENI